MHRGIRDISRESKLLLYSLLNLSVSLSSLSPSSTVSLKMVWLLLITRLGWKLQVR